MKTTIYREIGDAEIEINVEGTVTAGTREVRYLRNGDPGYPAEPATVEIDSAEDAETGEPVELTDAETRKAEDNLLENWDGDDGGEDDDAMRDERREE